jgi:L-lactate dehydrogenase complex protein LldG
VSARDAVLGRIRAALADRPAPPPDVEVPPPTALEDPIGRLVERIEDYKATVTVTDDPEAAIAEALQRHGATDVVRADRGDQRADPRALDRVDGVVTTCFLAIAETGTIVLDHGPGQGTRAQSLVPDLHVCVVRADQVVAAVPDAIAALRADAPLTLVSGPSATSDIELNRVEGVHGPRRLDVVVVA